MNPGNEKRSFFTLFVAVMAICFVASMTVGGYALERVAERKALTESSRVLAETCLRENGKWGCFFKLHSSFPPPARNQADRYVSDFRYFVPLADLLADCGLSRKAACGATIVSSGAFRQNEVDAALKEAE